MASRVSLATFLLGASADPSWTEFKVQHGRVYSEQEESSRYEIFRANAKIVDEVNSQKLPFSFELNKFADWTPEEFKGLLGYSQRPIPKELHMGTHVPSGVAPPASIDWVSKGAVTPVKNQGQCGSCWTFSTTGGLEGAWQLATGHLVSFSEQELVDCSHNGGNNGCNGGLMDHAFTWLETHNVCTENGYAAYSASDGSCRLPCSHVGIPKGGLVGYTDVSGGENGLLSAVAERPVSIAVDAGSNWQMYSGGVLTSECGQQLDHGVLAVGYGKDGANEYWKVKNSWGTGWGEAGYIRIVRGRNSCGISNAASYPRVNGNVPPAPPTPPTPPSPPTPPTPGCKDDFPECKSWPCEFFANVCHKKCGCCGPNPPSNCVSASSVMV